MSRQYPGVPEYLRISDQPARMGICTANQVYHAHKMAWTPALEELAHRMREDGETWRGIAEELADRTGIRISDNATSDYIERKYGEKRPSGTRVTDTRRRCYRRGRGYFIGGRFIRTFTTVYGEAGGLPPHFTKQYSGR